MQDELLTMREVQALLKCSSGYVYKLVERKKLRAVRIPRNDGNRYWTRVRQSDLKEFLNAHTSG